MPLVIRLVLAVVPPMSKPMARAMRRCVASRPAPIMPATGPDSIIETGSSSALRIDMTPPLERIMWTLPRKSAPRRKPSSVPR
jgi:hypothetical protein